MKRVIFILLLITHMCVIFSFSMQPAEVSGEQSGKFIKSCLNVLPGFSDMPEHEKDEIADNLDFAVRKCAHFSVFAMLGLLAFCTFSSFRKVKYKKEYLIIFLFCVIYAVSDEVHQYFVPGRACRFLDVTIDSLGSATGIFVMKLLYKLKRW